MAYAVRETISAFRRAPLLTGLSALMVGLALLVLGLFSLVTLWAAEAKVAAMLHDFRAPVFHGPQLVGVVSLRHDDRQRK